MQSRRLLDVNPSNLPKKDFIKRYGKDGDSVRYATATNMVKKKLGIGEGLTGAAAGAGLSIALACDLRVASSNAFITTAFRNVGLSGDYGASWFLPRLIGLSKAKELFYTARRVSAEEGERLGLFNQVFPEETFRDDAFTYAREIANGPSDTLSRMKTNLNQGVSQGLKASLLLEAQHLIESAGSAEAKEAISAFMEKRTPKFHP